MAEYEIGELVQLDGFPLVRVSDVSELDTSELGVVLDCAAGSFPLVIPLGVVRVTRVAIGPWPPQTGDVWRDRNGDLWFAVDMRNIDETDVPDVRLVYANEGGYVAKPAEAAEHHGPFTLVHREQQAGGESL